MEEEENVLPEEAKARLRKTQEELIRIIEAFAALEESKEWGVLKELVFGRSLAAIERQILNEAVTPQISTDKLYRLQGEWAWAKQYNDTGRFVQALKKQLEDIKNKLK